MIHKDVYNIFTLIANDKYIRISAFGVTAFTVFVAIFFSPLAGLLIYGSYILGYILCWCFIKYNTNASSYLIALVSYCYSSSSRKKSLKQSCSICDDFTCRRHQQNKAVAPWRDLRIPENLNAAIEKFYNRILHNFILEWYGQFTDDVDFVNELRYCLRYASATAINRFLELDHGNIITKKLLPYIIKHIDDYMYMQQIMKLKNSRFDDVVVEYLGKRLHPATANRKNELNYLRKLSASLLSNLLPERYLECKNFAVLIREIVSGWVLLPLMDVVADPNIINSLVILAVNYKSKVKLKKKSSGLKDVEFLHSFLVESNKKSSFGVDLNAIKENTYLLYCFMQFLKREEHVHLLQFCLDVDEFNNKLLTPDLTKNQMDELYSDAKTLYKEYIDVSSVNFIGCLKEISEELDNLIKEGVCGVAKLRTTKPLYQAYEHTFNVLENSWLPEFFHSDEFYGFMCGSKITASYNKDSVSRSQFGSPLKSRIKKFYDAPNQSTVAKISSGLVKIKGALRTNQPIDGAIYPTSETQALENGAMEEIIISECGNIFRDLTAWRIAILSYQTVNKVVSFCINVQRLDAVDSCNKHQWAVFRKDQDFHTLKSKLVEFHGESEICDSPLPSRKVSSSIDVRMEKYENFLQRLLQKPALRGSDLLHTFLTTSEDFSMMIASAQNVQDIGNIYQSVAHKLRKEKGQHLDSFMATFLLSTGRSKPGKIEWAEIGDEMDKRAELLQKNSSLPKTYRNHIFNDNFGISYNVQKDGPSSSFNPVGVTQSFFYLLKYIFKVPHYLLRLFAAVCSLSHEAVESFASHFIERKLKSNLNGNNLAYLIKLLEDVVFTPHTSPTREELEERKIKAFNELEHVLPSVLEKLIGNNFSMGCKMLLEILQHPHYNKQLAYNLFDLVFLELYPSLGSNKEI